MAERFTRVPSAQEIWSSNPGPAKSCTALQRFVIASMSLVPCVVYRRGDGHRKLVTHFRV